MIERNDPHINSLLAQIYLLAGAIDGLFELRIDENGQDLYMETDKFLDLQETEESYSQNSPSRLVN